ncbi:hypothetical protein NM208_g5555 [Fusarium decemcellulare]|uniref:Uncharacterized protein n=1 Tax=Fusarium decemcellulare TaxID=57161 RepID=A0ACC1SGU3_9HYPO|nr:hypothetical protein NM208_g5555 [Fusarium decemcellulare]
MTDIETDRRRTRPEDEDSEDEEEPQPDSPMNERNFRSRVDEYPVEADWPREPLYMVGEVVYVAFSGQQQPAGPYVIISTNFENQTYGIQSQATGQKHPTAVPESLLRVLV